MISSGNVVGEIGEGAKLSFCIEKLNNIFISVICGNNISNTTVTDYI